VYEAVLDTPFRTSGVLHEMKRRGIALDDKAVHDYLNDPGNDLVRQHVAHYAREAYINFGKLSPVERQVVTRAFFLWPWLRGSARYTIRFFIEHPAQAAVLVKLGQTQIERNKNELGNPEDWLSDSGAFKIGGTDALPKVLNPQAATILGQFPQLLLEAQRDPIGSIFQHLSPAVSLAASVGMKHDPFFGSSLHGSRASILLDQTLGQFPLFQVFHPGATPPAGKATYPGSRRKQAAGKLILGGMYPRTLNRANVQKTGSGGKKDYFGGGGAKPKKNYFGGSSGKSTKDYWK
jgi:hypothetical protein